MALHVFLFLLVFFLILSLALLWRLCWLPLQPSPSQAGSRRRMVHRLLKPRTPLDCPICRLCGTPSSGGGPAPVRPWHEVKSRRGAPKRIPTDGFACPNQQCSYFGISDVRVHASLGRWQAWPGRTHPDVSRSCLPYHVQCSTQHSLVPFENSCAPDRHGPVCSGRRVGPLRRRAGRRATGRRPSAPGCPARGCTLRPCMSTFSVNSSFPISSWTNCGRGCAATPTSCGCGWPSTPVRAILPVLHLGPRTQNAAHAVIHALRRILAAFLSPTLHERWSQLVFLCGSRPISDTGS